MSCMKCLEILWVSNLHNMQNITIQHIPPHSAFYFTRHIGKGGEARV